MYGYLTCWNILFWLEQSKGGQPCVDQRTPFMRVGLSLGGEQLTQNWYKQGESNCLIITKIAIEMGKNKTIIFCMNFFLQNIHQFVDTLMSICELSSPLEKLGSFFCKYLKWHELMVAITIKQIHTWQAMLCIPISNTLWTWVQYIKSHQEYQTYN